MLSGLCVAAVVCLAAGSRSVKAINCSWCSKRWTQEDSYPSAPYFMVWVHYVQHSEGIHHSAMEDLSFWSLENISVGMHAFVCVCVCAAVTIVSHVMSLLSTVFNGFDWSHFPCSSQYTHPKSNFHSPHFFIALGTSSSLLSVLWMSVKKSACVCVREREILDFYLCEYYFEF